MFSHIMVGTNDLDRSKHFYDAVLRVLGFEGEAAPNVSPSGHPRLFYRHNGGTFGVTVPIDGQSATYANGGTIGFECASPAQVKEFHDVAIANGGTSIEDPPGLRDGSVGKYDLAYLRDPDGNKLCALYRHT